MSAPAECGQDFMAGTICALAPGHDGPHGTECQVCGGDWYNETCTCSDDGTDLECSDDWVHDSGCDGFCDHNDDHSNVRLSAPVDWTAQYRIGQEVEVGFYGGGGKRPPDEPDEWHAGEVKEITNELVRCTVPDQGYSGTSRNEVTHPCRIRRKTVIDFDTTNPEAVDAWLAS